MATTYANLKTQIATIAQDSGSAIISSGEIDYAILDALREIPAYVPYEVRETFTIEGRSGTATSTTASALVDATKEQFLATDTDKVIYNTTDKTWAVVTAYVSASQLTLSKDIMASGEGYKMFNKGCWGNNQINIENTTDYLEAIKAEYPVGCKPPCYRNVSVGGDILTIEMDRTPDDTSQSTADKEVYVYFNKRHKITQLTDTVGAVDFVGGYSAGDTSMVIDGLQATGTIEADQEFTIAGMRGTYRVTAAASIATNEATVSFWPGLESDVATDVVVTFKASTLSPRLESVLVDYAAGKCAINKANSLYLQAQAAIAVISTVSTQTGLMTARLAQAVTDIGSGRTENAKTVNIVSSGATALSNVAAQLTLAISDLADSRTEADKVAALVVEANTEIDLINPQVDLAVTALSSGNSLLNTVPIGGGAPEYMAQAQADLQAALGFYRSGEALLTQAKSDENLSRTYANLASGEVQAGLSKVQEALGFFRQATTDESISTEYRGIAAREIDTALAYASQSMSYLRQVSSQLDIAGGGRYMQAWGNEKLREARTALRQLGGYKTSQVYSRW